MLRISPDDALAELCRRSFYTFFKEFWFVVSPEELELNWHIKYLCDELQKVNDRVRFRQPKLYDLVINIPPATTKSTIVLQMYNAWCWTTDPAQRFISSSHTAALSISHSMKTRDIVTSDKYKKLFPNVELKPDQALKTDFRTEAGGQRYTTSTTGKPTGVHAHQKLIDDPQDTQNATSETERITAKEHLKALDTRNVNNKMTPTILVMQRLHEDDLAAEMLSRKNIKHICLPAEESDEVKPAELRECYTNGLLDPKRLSREVLADKKKTLGSYGYSGQYGQRPVDPKGGVFKRDWFNIEDWNTKHDDLIWHFMSDTAYTSDEENDPSGFVAYARTGELNQDIIIRFAEDDYLEFPQLCKKIKSFVHKHGYTTKSIIEVEPKASGKSAVQQLKADTDLNIKEAAVPIKDKIARAKSQAPKVEAGRVTLIRGNWNDAFLDQVCSFPRAPHDEFVDCLTAILGGKKSKRRGLKKKN